MTLNFPNNPRPGDTFYDPVSGNQWKWDGSVWTGVGNLLNGPQGPQGPPGLVIQATEDAIGGGEIATQVETTTGTDDARIVTPKKLKVELDKKVSDAPDGTAAGTKQYVRRVTTTGSGTLTQSKTWEEPTFTQAGTGAVTRSLESKLRDVVSIKDFGAVGDFSASAVKAIEDAIASGAKTIHIPVGVYLIDRPIATNGQSDINFCGEGSGSVLKLAAGYNDKEDRLFFNINVNHDNWRFEDFVIDGNSSNMGTAECTRDKLIKMKGNNVSFRNVVIRNEAGRGGITWLGDDQIYSNCQFFNIGVLAKDSSAVHPGNGASPASNVVIADCIFNTPDASSSPNFYRLTAIDAVILDNCTVTGCTIRGGNKGMIFSWGETNCRNLTITANTIYPGRSYGIHFYKNDDGDSSNKIQDIVISGNTLKGTSGINLNGGQKTTPVDNFRGVRNVSITGNVIENSASGGNGLAVRFAYGVSISGNTIHDCAGNAVDLRKINNSVITGNNLDNSQTDGLYFTDAKKILISGNDISFNGRHGINFDTADGVIISGNSCNNNSTGTYNLFDGIRASGSVTNMTIQNNVCSNIATWPASQSYGINIDSTSNVSNVQILNNVCDANKSNGQIRTERVSAIFDYIRLGNVGKDRTGNGGVDDSRASDPTTNNYIGKIYLHKSTGTGPVYRYCVDGANTWVDM